jgi:hypothetical protein
MTALVDDVATSNPKTIGRDTLAGEALELLNAARYRADRDRRRQAGQDRAPARSLRAGVA